MEKYDICMLCPPSGKIEKWEYNLDLGYLEAYLNKCNISSKQIIPTENIKLIDLINIIINYNPKMIIYNSYVGYGCFDINMYYILLISNLIKSQKTQIKQVIIGSSTIYNSEEILKKANFIDYTIIGDPEVTIVNLYKALFINKSAIYNIEGISYMNKKNFIQQKNKKVHQKNLDDFQSPIITGIYSGDKKRIPIITSRGCAFNCSYCCFSNKYCNNSVRFYSVESVINELQYIYNHYKEYNPTVVIIDEAFSINIDRAKKICKEILNKKIKLSYVLETRIDLVDTELLSLLKRIGVKKIDFGLESTNIKTLKEIKKVYGQTNLNNFLKNIKEKVKFCKKIGIIPMVNFIVGLPNEDEKDINNTMKFIEELDIQYSINKLRIYKGTELYNNYKKYGYEIKHLAYPLLISLENRKIDENNIEITEKSTNIKYLLKLKKMIINLFENNNKKKLIILKIYDNYNKLEQNIYDFLKNNLELHSELFIETNLDNLDQIINDLVENKIPTNKIIIILNKKDYFLIYEYLNDLIKIKLWINKNIKLLDYKDFCVITNQKKFQQHNLNPLIIFSKKTYNDLNIVIDGNNNLISSSDKEKNIEEKIINFKNKDYLEYYINYFDYKIEDFRILEKFLDELEKNFKECLYDDFIKYYRDQSYSEILKLKEFIKFYTYGIRPTDRRLL